MFVCHCRALTDGEIREVITGGACDLDEVGDRCGAGITCGGCCPLIQGVLGAPAEAPRAGPPRPRHPPRLLLPADRGAAGQARRGAPGRLRLVADLLSQVEGLAELIDG